MRPRDVPLETEAARIGPLAAIIPAHNEAAVLDQTLTSLRAAASPPDPIIVVADRCSDATASIAREAGAVVFERDEGEGTKGQALRWLFARNPPELAACPIVAIFDADSTVHPDFFSVVRRAFAGGAQVAQSFVQPVGAEHSTASALAAYSEVLSQVADDALRARLGWPVRLRGTGMVFQTHLLREVLPHTRTQVEDVELSLLLAARGVRVIFLPEAVVYDPKPPTMTLVSRQRARWLQAQADVWRAYWPLILRLLGKGPAMWWLLQAHLLKPKTALGMLKLMAFVLVLILPVWLWIKIVLGALVVIDALYYLAGLWLVPRADRGRYARALLGAPLYIMMWSLSLVTALRHRTGWLSVRH